MPRGSVETETTTTAPTVDERLLALLERQQATMQTQVERTAPKENPNYVVNSPTLKPNGELHAKDLKCRIYFGSIGYNNTPLTAAEVVALNRLQPLAEGRIPMNDGAVLRVSVVGTWDAVGRLDKLTITPQGEHKNLNLLMPSIEVMARALAEQAQVPA